MHGAIINYVNPVFSDIPVSQDFPETNSEFVASIMFHGSVGFVIDSITD